MTQVSAERLFSAMRLLLTDLWSRLKQSVVEAILLLRTNGQPGGLQLTLGGRKT